MNPIQQNPLLILTGGLGGDFLSDTNTHNGSWGMLVCLTACTFTTLTSDNVTLNGTIGALATMTPPANSVIFGHFTVIKLASGQMVAYGC